MDVPPSPGPGTRVSAGALLWKEVAGLGKKSLDSYIFGQDHPKKKGVPDGVCHTGQHHLCCQGRQDRAPDAL
jgi:hypothetical protein